MSTRSSSTPDFIELERLSKYDYHKYTHLNLLHRECKSIRLLLHRVEQFDDIVKLLELNDDIADFNSFEEFEKFVFKYEKLLNEPSSNEKEYLAKILFKHKFAGYRGAIVRWLKNIRFNEIKIYVNKFKKIEPHIRSYYFNNFHEMSFSDFRYKINSIYIEISIDHILYGYRSYIKTTLKQDYHKQLTDLVYHLNSINEKRGLSVDMSTTVVNTEILKTIRAQKEQYNKKNTVTDAFYLIRNTIMSFDYYSILKQLSKTKNVTIIKTDDIDQFIYARIKTYKNSQTFSPKSWCIQNSKNYWVKYAGNYHYMIWNLKSPYYANTIIGFSKHLFGKSYSFDSNNNSLNKNVFKSLLERYRLKTPRVYIIPRLLFKIKYLRHFITS